MLPNAKPPSCDLQVPKSCQSTTLMHYTLLFTAFALMSTAAGGIRPCSLAFGADQINCKDNPKREMLLESFFGESDLGSRLFLCSFLLSLLLLLIKMKVENSLFTSLCQVVSVAWKKRNVTLPDSSDGSWHYRNDTKVATPIKNLS
nr:hypothetical protein [Tanacetum cinerariifolium]